MTGRKRLAMYDGEGGYVLMRDGTGREAGEAWLFMHAGFRFQASFRLSREQVAKLRNWCDAHLDRHAAPEPVRGGPRSPSWR